MPAASAGHVWTDSCGDLRESRAAVMATHASARSAPGNETDRPALVEPLPPSHTDWLVCGSVTVTALSRRRPMVDSRAGARQLSSPEPEAASGPRSPAASPRRARGSSSTTWTPPRPRRVAEEIGGIAVAGDASDIVDAAREALGGTVDVYCANAGLASGGDAERRRGRLGRAPGTSTSWPTSARRKALLPDWLERGSGRFVSTVSAAGLLTMIGAAPYSVTKHGAYAFAEWLSLTYRHRGIKVHAICPQGVRTDMLTAAGSRGRPGARAHRDRARGRRRRPLRRAWRRTASWSCRTPRSPGTTGPAPTTPTTGWQHEPPPAEVGGGQR